MNRSEGRSRGAPGTQVIRRARHLGPLCGQCHARDLDGHSTDHVQQHSTTDRCLKKMTEDGTLEVMRLTELLQDHHASMAEELSGVVEALKAIDCATLAGRLEHVRSILAQDDKHLMEIMTALSFQDLVAQRVKKLVAILDEVQTKLVELVVVFGLQRNGHEAVGTGIADQMLKQLEESKTTAMKQQVADDLLAQFGFK